MQRFASHKLRSSNGVETFRTAAGLRLNIIRDPLDCFGLASEKDPSPFSPRWGEGTPEPIATCIPASLLPVRTRLRVRQQKTQAR